MKTAIGIIISFFIAFAIGFLIWGMLVPFLCGFVPVTFALKWLVDLAIYIIVGFGGGIGLPIGILFAGISASLIFGKF
jgi:hypothetical protein